MLMGFFWGRRAQVIFEFMLQKFKAADHAPIDAERHFYVMDYVLKIVWEVPQCAQRHMPKSGWDVSGESCIVLKVKKH